LSGSNESGMDEKAKETLKNLDRTRKRFRAIRQHKCFKCAIDDCEQIYKKCHKYFYNLAWSQIPLKELIGVDNGE